MATHAPLPLQLQLLLCDFGLVTEKKGRRTAVCKRCGAVTPHLPPESRLQIRPCGVRSSQLPGTELHYLLAEFGVTPNAKCGCEERLWRMNMLGLEGCKRQRKEIAGWLSEAAAKRNWAKTLIAAMQLVVQPWFRPLDPFGCIVDEAIRRAEEKANPPAAPSLDTH